MAAIIGTALGCIMAMVDPAAAEVAPSQLGGRWTTANVAAKRDCREASCRQTYDITPCADGWCGIEVTEGGTCGRTALRLDAGAAQPFGVEFSGRYERAEGTQAYTVRATMYANAKWQGPNEQLLLSVYGNTGGDFQAFRRTYPLHLVLARQGDAVCAQPKVS